MTCDGIFDPFSLLVHIRSVHFKEDLGEFQLRGPGATPKFWSIEPDCVSAAAKSKKVTLATSGHSSTFQNHTTLDSYPSPNPIQRNSAHWTFSNEIIIKRDKGKSATKYKIEPFTATTLQENASFILNTVGDVYHFSWLRVQQHDALVMATDSILSPDTGRASSTLQFWSFDTPLQSNTVKAPKLILSKNCPFGILSTCQVTSLNGRGCCAIACTDGTVRLIRIGLYKQQFAVDIARCRLLSLG